MSTRYLAALGLIIIVVAASVSIYILSTNDTEPIDLGLGFSNVQDAIINYDGSLTANVNFTQKDFYKGDNIPFDLEVSVVGSLARLDVITITVMDLNLTRSANQAIPIDILVNSGIHTIPLELSPGFNLDGFVALVNKNYTLTKYNLNFTQVQEKRSISGTLNHNLYGQLHSTYDQASEMTWNEIQKTNATVVFNNNNVTLASIEENATATIYTEIETTGYTRLFYNVSGQSNSSIQIGISNLLNITNSTAGYLPIGEFQGRQNVTILFNILKHENISLIFSVPTRKLVIMVVVANNNWDREFRPSGFYLDQINLDYSNVFNITFVGVAEVDFDFSAVNTNLFDMRDKAIETVGSKLKLIDSEWQDGVGSQINNAGGDILLILTNKTMDNLGIVFGISGNKDNNLNMAIAAGGSLNTGELSIELRLTSGWADNLIQHELSHIFKAPDRWTEDDPASIMTKSTNSDAYLDIVTLKFWLFRTNWLEQDIQTMVDHTYIFRVEY